MVYGSTLFVEGLRRAMGVLLFFSLDDSLTHTLYHIPIRILSRMSMHSKPLERNKRLLRAGLRAGGQDRRQEYNQAKGGWLLRAGRSYMNQLT